MSLVINFLTGAPRTPTPLPPDPPVAGDGQFGNMLDDLWQSEGQAGGFLGDASPSARSDRGTLGPSVADVFNQYGFLARDDSPVRAETAPSPVSPATAPQHAPDGLVVAASEIGTSEVSRTVAAPIAHLSAPRPIITRPLTPTGATAPASQRFDVGAPVPQCAQMAVGRVGALERADSKISQPVLTAHTVHPVKHATLQGASVMQEFTEVPEDSPDAGKTPNRREAPESGAGSDAHVTFSLNDQGANIAVRAIDDGQVERTKLRDRIVALLSRYGVRGGELRLNGALSSIGAAPQEEDR